MIDLREDWEIANDAMENTYLLLTNRKSFEEILENNQEFVVSLNSKSMYNFQETIDNLIEHFISTEEYEKCSELKKIREDNITELNKLLKS